MLDSKSGGGGGGAGGGGGGSIPAVGAGGGGGGIGGSSRCTLGCLLFPGGVIGGGGGGLGKLVPPAIGAGYEGAGGGGGGMGKSGSSSKCGSVEISERKSNGNSFSASLKRSGIPGGRGGIGGGGGGGRISSPGDKIEIPLDSRPVLDPVECCCDSRLWGMSRSFITFKNEDSLKTRLASYLLK